MNDTTTMDPRDPAATPAPSPSPEPAVATTPRRATAEPAVEPASAPATATAQPPQPAGTRTPLFDERASGDLRNRWSDVQAHFVDEPRVAVEQADGLVGDVMQRLTDTFKTERQSLEAHWSRGDDVSTEDLRLALQRYRSFFDRLLSL